jgi:hypothetical protein
MPYGRNMNDAVLLPNGQVIIVNGARVSVLQGVAFVFKSACEASGLHSMGTLVLLHVQLPIDWATCLPTAYKPCCFRNGCCRCKFHAADRRHLQRT